jgi:hypothetical protein
MRTARRVIVATAVSAIAVLLAAGAAVGKQGTRVPSVSGQGVDANQLVFWFRAMNADTPSGHALFETNSFGNPDGAVDCIEIRRRKAAIAGTMDVSTSGLTHFMLIFRDRPRRPHHRPRDLFTSWMRNGPFDCHTEAFGGTLDDSMERIRRGDIRIVR